MTEAAADAGTVDAGAQQEATTESTPWYGADADPDYVNWIESKGMTGEDGAQKMALSYRDLEKTFHETRGAPERVLMMPEDMENADQVNEFHMKLGRPEDISGYGIEVEDGDVITQTFLENAFKSGLSKDSVQSLIGDTQKLAAEIQEKQESDYQESLAEAQKNWESKQGMALEDAKLKITAAETLFPEVREMADAIERAYGPEKYADFCVKLGEALGEDKPAGVGGQDSSGFMNIEGAKQELAMMKGDATKMDAYGDPDHPQHKAVAAQMDRLYKMAYPEG